MPAIEDRSRFLCAERGGINVDISSFVYKELVFFSRDAGRSEDGACFRL